METKDEWIDSVMESLDGTETRACPAELKERLLNGIPERGRTVPLYFSQTLWKAAAVILLLLGLNIVTILQYSRNEAGDSDSAGTVATEYFSYIDNFNL